MDMGIYDNANRLRLRYSEVMDTGYLYEWLSKAQNTSDIHNFFMADNEAGIALGAYRWSFSFSLNASITLLIDNIPIGIASLWLNELETFCHTGMFGMIVDPHYRGLGFGTLLCNNIIHFAKTNFNFDRLCAHVVSTNIPARKLYESFGFKTLYEDPKFVKRDNKYISVLYIEKLFLK